MRTLYLCEFGLRDNSRKEATKGLCMSNNLVFKKKKKKRKEKKKEHYPVLKKKKKKKKNICAINVNLIKNIYIIMNQIIMSILI